MPRPAIGRNSSNNKTHNHYHPMAWPIINILLAAVVLYLACAASGLAVG